VAGGWRKLHNEELHNLYASPNIVTVTKPTTMRLARHVARLEAIRNAYKILLENLKERDWLEYLDIDGRIISEQNLRK
jgi:hypothetical protein